MQQIFTFNNCTDNLDCNNGMYNNGNCTCFPGYTGLYCDQRGVSITLIAVFQIILPFIGLGGIGNLVAHRILSGLLQFFLTSFTYVTAIIIFCLSYDIEYICNQTSCDLNGCVDLVIIMWCYTICCCGLCRLCDKLQEKPVYGFILIITVILASTGIIWSVTDGFLFLAGSINV